MAGHMRKENGNEKLMAKNMRVYYDCEFLEDGYTVDLISIGMVREDGKEFYAVSNEFDKRRVAENDWLMENVMSSIDHTTSLEFDTLLSKPYKWLTLTDPAAMSRDDIKYNILYFISDIWPSFWAWYGAYDHVALCQLFGRMIDLPNRMPMFTCDIKQLHKQAGSPSMPEQPEGKHNALEDAKFNIVRYDYLQRYLLNN